MTKRQKLQRALLGLFVLGLPVLALQALPRPGSSGAGPSGAAAGSRLPVEVVRVERTSGYDLRRAYTGEVRARRSVMTSFELGGRIEELLVDEGQRVEQGDGLARLDDRRLQARRAGLEAERKRLAAVLAEMEAGPRAQTIAAAAAELEALRAERSLARLQVERRQGLAQRDSISTEELDRVAAQELVLAAREAAAEAQLAELREGTRVEVIEAQEASLEAVEALLASIDIDLEDCLLRAPFAGTVARRLLDEGTVVQAGQAILHIVEDGRLEARIGLPVDAAASLGESAPRLLVGGIEVSTERPELLPELDELTRTRTAVFAIAGAARGSIAPGQVARLELVRRVERPGIWLPLRSLTEGSRGLWSCYVVTPEEGDAGPILERADVEVLHVDGERALVRGTLREGDRVVVSGTHRVSPGQAVDPRER